MKKIIVCSGAGLSQESGVPTFRGATGLWENHSITDVCNIKTFEKNHDLVNQFYNARRTQLATVVPNAAHLKIAKLQERFDVINLTTNVDDLLEQAGCTNVVHMHGILTEVIYNYDYGNVPQEPVSVGYDEVDYTDASLFPIKPNVVFFGQNAPEYQRFYDIVESATDTDIVVIVGSSETVFQFYNSVIYVCQFPGKVFFVNTDPSAVDAIRSTDNTTLVTESATNFFDNIEKYL